MLVVLSKMLGNMNMQFNICVCGNKVPGAKMQSNLAILNTHQSKLHLLF